MYVGKGMCVCVCRKWYKVHQMCIEATRKMPRN